MATALTVIQNAMRLIGVLAQGETPSSSEAADALSRLNLMLAEWSIQRIFVFSVRKDLHVLSAGVQDYTIGTGGAINVPRPVKIAQAGIIQSNGLRSELEILETEAQWAAIPEKGVSAVQPLKLYDDYAYPLSTLSLWPKPSGTPTLELYSWQKLPSFAATGDTFDMPPGYQQAVEYNLAILLAPEYGRPIDAVVASIAGSSKTSIAQINVGRGLPPPPPQAQSQAQQA